MIEIATFLNTFMLGVLLFKGGRWTQRVESKLEDHGSRIVKVERAVA